VGIKLPAFGPEIFIGPSSAHELDAQGEAPTSALRLPGGMLSWLLLLVLGVILIWGAYFGVMYQVFRISVVAAVRDTNIRLVPLISLAAITVLGILLVLKLITGPYSHFHLLP
jgi:hypothetical protein